MPVEPLTSRLCMGLGGLAIGFSGFLYVSCGNGSEKAVDLNLASGAVDASSRGLSLRRFEGGGSLAVVSTLEAGFRIFSGLKGFENMTGPTKPQWLTALCSRCPDPNLAFL